MAREADQRGGRAGEDKGTEPGRRPASGAQLLGWEQRPSSNELYEAIRARTPTQRERAILECWASEAEWEELLQAWTEHAYTFRELAAALHRAGLSRCRAAAALNSWAGELNHAIGAP